MHNLCLMRSCRRPLRKDEYYYRNMLAKSHIKWDLYSFDDNCKSCETSYGRNLMKVLKKLNAKGELGDLGQLEIADLVELHTQLQEPLEKIVIPGFDMEEDEEDKKSTKKKVGLTFRN